MIIGMIFSWGWQNKRRKWKGLLSITVMDKWHIYFIVIFLILQNKGLALQQLRGTKNSYSKFNGNPVTELNKCNAKLTVHWIFIFILWKWKPFHVVMLQEVTKTIRNHPLGIMNIHDKRPGTLARSRQDILLLNKVLNGQITWPTDPSLEQHKNPQRLNVFPTT